MRGKLPWRTRLMTMFLPAADWDSSTPEQIVDARAAQRRVRRSPLITAVTGRPNPAARISTHPLELPGRRLQVRVYRPAATQPPVPLVIAFHGGGFITGSPDQDDWLLAQLAAQCPAVVASVDYRLAPEYPVPAQIHDAFDAVPALAEQAARWGGDRNRIALLGSDAGATLAALAAIRAAERDWPVCAQVLINPQLDWSDQAFAYPSCTQNADSPTASPAQLRAAARLAVPESFDPQVISPLHCADIAGVAPALIQAAGLDPLADHSDAYADRSSAAGTQVTLTRYPTAVHSFLTMPGACPAARDARAEILRYLRTRLSATGTGAAGAPQARIPEGGNSPATTRTNKEARG